MTTQITPESISLTVHQNTPVITTELLAGLYGSCPKLIRQNYQRNAERFVAGKHFFKLTGAELKAFKNEASKRGFVKIAPTTNHLILWTERGAARHAKMLETDQAWEVFEKLEDCYFAKKVEPLPPKGQPTVDIATLISKFTIMDVIWESAFKDLKAVDPKLANYLMQSMTVLGMAINTLKGMKKHNTFADGDDFLITARKFAEVAKKRGYLLVKTVA